MRKIVTKSIQLHPSSKDSIRICVMRRIRPEFKFDLWIPKLAPGEKLLKDYVINKKISWTTFKHKYMADVIKKNTPLLKTLAYLSLQKKITLLCWEKSANRCHRILLAQACKNINL